MRDIKRIEPFLEKFKELWELYPDSRYGQLIYMVAEKLNYSDIFFPEEQHWIEAIEKVINERKEW